MQAKIEWFKEILELDPSSKVFFPLAKMLADAGQTHEALELVREGVARHPDFLEARFYALELCARLGDDEAVAEEAGYIGDILGKYPLFWKAWAQNLARKAETRDAALALDFVSVHFQGAPVSWGEVIQRGLEGLFHHHQTTLPFSGETDSFLHRPQAPVTPATHPAQGGAAAPAAAKLPVEPSATAAPEAHVSHEEFPASTASPEALAPVKAAEAAEMTAPPSVPLSAPMAAVTASKKSAAQPSEEVYSIRTRTMARLLAEQGDYDGALEIYRELLAKADDDDEREELDAIIERMQLMLRDGTATPQPSAAPPTLSLQMPGLPEQSEQQPAPSASAVRTAKIAAPVVDVPAVSEASNVPDSTDSVESVDFTAVPDASPVVSPLVSQASAVREPAEEAPVEHVPMAMMAPGAVSAVVDTPPPGAPSPAPPRAQKSSRSALERLALRLERRAAR